MIRYHGAFAPNAAARKAVVPTVDDEPRGEPRCTHAGRQAWAMLIKRVFSEDVMRCRRCGGTNTRVRFVTAGDEIRQVLDSVGYPNAPDAPGDEGEGPSAA